MKKFYFIQSLFILLIPYLSNAQNVSFIKLADEDNIQLTSAEYKSKVSLEANKNYKSVKFVNVANLSDIQQKGKLSFIIPGRSDTIMAMAKRVHALSNKNYNWYGTIKDGGYIIALCKNGKMTIHISLNDQVYEIFHFKDDLYQMIELNMNEYANRRCGNDNVKVDSLRAKNRLFERKIMTPNGVVSCYDNVRVLVLYTALAASSVPDINQTIDLALAQHTSVKLSII